ncbi:hypothetical protein HU200_024691 [Digitaria exilis]|uniref:BPM/SPOP BACK domain-containing protein n=1 Tax=Digitaria exilis TaxID=1010633 RepID=A0A835BYX2_9POAL|nr:hypothetical protein HU200_024691 [Digitaria exilis]
MNQTRTHLGDAACSTHLLKIDSSSRTGGLRLLSCMCEFDGHDWEIRFFDPCNLIVDESRIGLILGFLGENGVRAALSCRLVDPSGAIEPSPVKRSPTTTFRCPSDSPAYVALMTVQAARSSGYMSDECLTVECTIAVFKDRILVPSSPSLAEHLGQLLESKAGADKLKGKCVEFIAGGSRGNLDAVMETEGFKDLAVNNPSLMAELLVAAHGRKH